MLPRRLLGKRVLVVEDEPLIGLDLCVLLQGHGAKPRLARTVEQALRQVESKRFHAAVCDMNLRGERSDLVLRALVHRGVPVVIQTGYELRDGVPPGVSAVLPKPLNRDRLIEAVHRAMH